MKMHLVLCCKNRPTRIRTNVRKKHVHATTARSFFFGIWLCIFRFFFFKPVTMHKNGYNPLEWSSCDIIAYKRKQQNDIDRKWMEDRAGWMVTKEDKNEIEIQDLPHGQFKMRTMLCMLNNALYTLIRGQKVLVSDLRVFFSSS